MNETPRISPPSPRPRIRVRPASAPHDAGVARLVVDNDRLENPSNPKRKANRTSWTKGRSGNPKGRPTGAKGVKATTRRVLMELVEAAPGKKMTLFEALLRQEAQSAAKGDWRARATMFNLSRWVLGSEPDSAAPMKIDEDVSEAGRAILEWFADEVRHEQELD